MQYEEFPFNEFLFNNETSVLLDACFLLAICNENDKKYEECLETFEILEKSNSKLYVTTIVWAEVLNVIINKLFVQDIRYKLDKTEPINKVNNIDVIVKNFDRKHKEKLSNYKKADKIPYKMYFNKIYKDKVNRNLLNIYFEEAVKIQKLIQERLKTKHVSLNKDSFELARKHVEINHLHLNDASHLAVSEQKSITYLLTLDGDFSKIGNSAVKCLKI
ncbi:type II toxin-antitoxin system VapC family toxin [Clostridium botulinum]|uniref:type II toxin-antitoxin system VapC family toxin n=1 Tax=Clostridium botulinum TaxID=1491 RepID=UPI003DA37532